MLMKVISEEWPARLRVPFDSFDEGKANAEQLDSCSIERFHVLRRLEKWRLWVFNRQPERLAGGAPGTGESKQAEMNLRPCLRWAQMRQRPQNGREPNDQTEDHPYTTNSISLESSRWIEVDAVVAASRCFSLSETARA